MSPIEDLARAYLHHHGARARLVRLPLAGAVAAGFRAGLNTVPESAVGTITWEEFLEAHGGAGHP